MDKVLDIVVAALSNELVLTLLVGGLVALYRSWRKDKAEKEIQAFDLAVKLAYDGVRNYAALYPSHKLDKAAKGLGIFSEALEAELGRKPSEAELKSAKLHFDAAHAAEVAPVVPK